MAEHKKQPIVAIDGPSGAGKSTISKLLAQRLGFAHIDTGAMYRCVALAVLRRGIDLQDHTALGALSLALSIDFRRDNGEQRVFLDGEDVSAAIRSPEVSLLTSRVSSVPVVRDNLVDLQRRMGAQGGVVLEGRDIGTVVFPQAQAKFYLTASAEERGHRRYLELKAKGLEVELEKTIAEVKVRDEADSTRQHSPLCQAADAILIDSTGMSIEAVVAQMQAIVAACGHAQGEGTCP